MKLSNYKHIFYILLFGLSLFVINISNFNDWILVSLLIQVVWISLTSNKIISKGQVEMKNKLILTSFNRFTIVLLIIDFVIMFLSTSFGFRLLFANFYRPTMYLTLISIFISILISYFIIIKFLRQNIDSRRKLILYILTTLFYPSGQLSITLINKKIANILYIICSVASILAL